LNGGVFWTKREISSTKIQSSRITAGAVSGEDHSEESFAGKCLARMRFQITLEGEGFVFLLEGAVKLDPSRIEFGCVRATVLVMCEESLFEIPSESNVGLVRLVYTSDDIDVEHGPCSVSAINFAGHASPNPGDALTRSLSYTANVACHA
jgi:hypothetical protein